MKTICPHCNKEFEVKKSRKVYQPGHHDPISKLKKILNYLKIQEDWVWIRRIAKETKLKPYSVSYLIEKYLVIYLEILEPETVYETTGIRMKMLRLKNKDIDVNKIIEDIKIRTNR